MLKSICRAIWLKHFNERALTNAQWKQRKQINSDTFSTFIVKPSITVKPSKPFNHHRLNYPSMLVLLAIHLRPQFELLSPRNKAAHLWVNIRLLRLETWNNRAVPAPTKLNHIKPGTVLMTKMQIAGFQNSSHCCIAEWSQQRTRLLTPQSAFA